jgi:hypothetical protein
VILSSWTLARIGPEKALSKIREYLDEIDRLENLGHVSGESQREELSHKIRGFINNAFDNPQDKLREYDSYVNAFFAVVGMKKTSQEKENDYQRDLREMKTMLGSYREELEMLTLVDYYHVRIERDNECSRVVFGTDFSETDLVEKIAKPYETQGYLYYGGVSISKTEVRRISIFRTNQTYSDTSGKDNNEKWQIIKEKGEEVTRRFIKYPTNP